MFVGPALPEGGDEGVIQPAEETGEEETNTTDEDRWTGQRRDDRGVAVTQ